MSNDNAPHNYHTYRVILRRSFYEGFLQYRSSQMTYWTIYQLTETYMSLIEIYAKIMYTHITIQK